MAIRKDVDYPGRWEAATTEYPMGKPKNRTTPTAKDGSYLEKKWVQDYEAFFGAILNAVGEDPNGLEDTAEHSQLFDAWRKIKYATATTTLKGIAELATQSEVDAGVQVDKIVTPHTLKSTLTGVGSQYDSAKHLATNGYQKFSNGLIIQWGRNVCTAGTSTTFSYPVAFPSQVFSLAVGSQTVGNANQYCKLISQTQFSLYSPGADVTETGTKWIAIGH